MPGAHLGLQEHEFRRLIEVREDYKETRRSLLRQHPAWGGESDARASALGRCANLIDAIVLCGFHEKENLASVSWWQKHVAADITPQRCGLRTALFDGFLITTAYVMSFSAVEHSIRVLLRALCPGACRDGRAEFGSVYQKLLTELDMKKWPPLLDVWGDLRNAVHNNGQFLPARGRDVNVTFGGANFQYRDGDHFIASWKLFIWLAARAREMLADIVGSQRIADLPVIADPYPLSPADTREVAVRFVHQCPDASEG